MKTKLVLFACFLQLSGLQFTKAYAQTTSCNINMILTVNGTVVESPAGFRVEVKMGGLLTTIPADYVPGRLILYADTQKLRKVDSIEIVFDNYSYLKNDQHIATLKVRISPNLLKKTYLILNFYDFYDKKYKRLYKKKLEQEPHWRQINMPPDFAVDVEYPGSGWFQEQR